jgi:hypothetical protein
VNAGTSTIVRFRPATTTAGPMTGPLGVSDVDVMVLPTQLKGSVHVSVDVEPVLVEYTRTFDGDTVVRADLGDPGGGGKTAGRNTAPSARYTMSSPPYGHVVSVPPRRKRLLPTMLSVIWSMYGRAVWVRGRACGWVEVGASRSSRNGCGGGGAG